MTPWALAVVTAGSGSVVDFESLIKEATDLTAHARLPVPAYRALQASSRNRESVHRDRPGWFADGDGTGFLRTVERAGRTEWTVMEHDGPGCLTAVWTPYFYYSLEDRTGPNVRVYLDGSDRPVIDEPLIRFVRGEGSVPEPFAFPTARAGDSYLPVPFAKSCRVTMTAKPFYYRIDYRAYERGTAVRTFQKSDGDKALSLAATVGRRWTAPPRVLADKDLHDLQAQGSYSVRLPGGPRAVTGIRIDLPESVGRPQSLRNVVLVATFDGERSVWCPVGDFFSNADGLHPFSTMQRRSVGDGTFFCTWPMPYRKDATLTLLNLGDTKVRASLAATTASWRWDSRSMHFHASWRPDDVAVGSVFQDWNFVDVLGKGVYVGDSWTVVNPQRDTWWGEGDEKFYVDDDWKRGFPSHFGTGTEDYYGWAGGVLPDRRDEFSRPFLANVRVGGLDGHTMGVNVCTRSRALDAVPFDDRLRFDMESSFGTDIRQPWNLLGYSSVAFWYGRPGASDNRPPQPRAASLPILTVQNLQRRSDAIREKVGRARTLRTSYQDP
ncbi:MAG: DUF2961 domain-containing protein [Armatimonadetes bacterium]|nr:DUF2961 domain-containing protein [Armatimonadota bacterium]